MLQSTTVSVPQMNLNTTASPRPSLPCQKLPGRGYQQDGRCDPGSPALPPALLRIAILPDCLHRLRLRLSRDDPANDQPNLPADANPPSLPVMAKNCATVSSMISRADLTLSIRPADCPASAGAASMSPWK